MSEESGASEAQREGVNSVKINLKCGHRIQTQIHIRVTRNMRREFFCPICARWFPKAKPINQSK